MGGPPEPEPGSEVKAGVEGRGEGEAAPGAQPPSSRGRNIHSPRRRRHVWQEALLGTGVFRRGLVRDCQPRRARARAGRLMVTFGGCALLLSLLSLLAVVVVVVVGDKALFGGGGGSVKKVGGRWEMTVSRSREGGRRRLDS